MQNNKLQSVAYVVAEKLINLSPGKTRNKTNKWYEKF